MKTDEMILLLAKTGLFFANCDGEYSESEKSFITEYIRGMKKQSILSDEVEQLLLDMSGHDISFEEVLADTDRLLGEFNPTEQQAIAESIRNFIRKVIEADSRLDRNEELYLGRWDAHFQPLLKR